MTDHITRAELLAALERAHQRHVDNPGPLKLLAAELRREPVAGMCRHPVPSTLYVPPDHPGPHPTMPCGNPIPCPLHPAPTPLDPRASKAERIRQVEDERHAGLLTSAEKVQLVAQIEQGIDGQPTPVPRVRITRREATPVTLDDSDATPVPRSHCTGCGAPYREEAPRCEALLRCDVCGGPDDGTMRPVVSCRACYDATHARSTIPFGPEPSVADLEHFRKCANLWHECNFPKGVALALLGTYAERGKKIHALHASEAALRAEVERLRVEYVATSELCAKEVGLRNEYAAERDALRAARDRALAVLEHYEPQRPNELPDRGDEVIHRVRKALKLP